MNNDKDQGWNAVPDSGDETGVMTPRSLGHLSSTAATVLDTPTPAGSTTPAKQEEGASTGSPLKELPSPECSQEEEVVETDNDVGSPDYSSECMDHSVSSQEEQQDESQEIVRGVLTPSSEIEQESELYTQSSEMSELGPPDHLTSSQLQQYSP